MELFNMSFLQGDDTEQLRDVFEEFFYFYSADEKDDPLDARPEEEILEMLYKQMEVFSQSALFANGIRQGMEDQKATGKIHIPEGMTDARAITKLFAEAGIIITGRDGKKDSTKTTIYNWLSGKKHPRHSVDVREDVFRLCFALKFNEKQTSEFFVKCYLDRPFNYRNLKEVVYYFCLKNGRGFKTAKEIIMRIGDFSVESPIQETRLIENELNRSNDTEAFIRYMITHRNSFDRPSHTIKTYLKRLFDECYEKACDEHPEIFSYKAGLDSEKDDLKSKPFKVHTVKKPILHTDHQKYKGMSIRKVLAAIYTKPDGNTQDKMYKEKVKKDVSVYKKSSAMEIPEIVSESMLKHTDSKLFSEENYKEGSNQTVRKALILLNFYRHMVGIISNNDYSPRYRNNRFCDFVDNTNDLLQECGFVQMYWRNPYDWFFLFCAATTNPLETFRRFSDPSEDPDEQEV